MGVDVNEVLLASKLVGQKTFFNEFIAFMSLADQIDLRKGVLKFLPEISMI